MPFNLSSSVIKYDPYTISPLTLSVIPVEFIFPMAVLAILNFKAVNILLLDETFALVI